MKFIIRLAFALCLFWAGELSAQTPLSAITSRDPTRDTKLVGHLPSGLAGQFNVGKVIGVYNVTHFGAKGDGSTDDTTAIAAAFAAAPAGATVYFPAGTYVLTNYITIGTNDVTVMGYGAKIISNATGQDRKFLVSGRSGIKFIGLKIDGGGRTVLTRATSGGVRYPHAELPGAIHFVDSTFCLVRDCDIKGINFPITLLGQNEDITIVNNQFASYYCAIQAGFSGYDSTEKSPKRLTIHGNHFAAGLYPLFPIAPVGSARDYTIVTALDTGAIRIRNHWVMSTANGRFFEKSNHSIIGNTIYRPGEIGIEIQAVNDSTVIGNTVHSCGLAGISLSVAQRIAVSSNTVSDCTYTGIEVDGYKDSTVIPWSEDITLANNTIDGCDEYGRQQHWIVVAGMVISGNARHVVVTGGSISYCRTGIMVRDATHVTIDGTRIITNEDGGYGGTATDEVLSGDWNQGIYVLRSTDVRLRGLTLTPFTGSWQRMVNLDTSSRVYIEDCDITANMNPVTIRNSSYVTIRDSALRMGATLGGDAKDFISVRSDLAAISNITIRNVLFSGTGAFSGINLNAPANSISNVLVENCDTRAATTSISLDVGFIFYNAYPEGSMPGGTISNVEIRNNIGPASGIKKNTISTQFTPRTGTVTDNGTEEMYFFSYGGTLNLAATQRVDRTVTIYYMEGSGTVTIHPSSGVKIDDSTSDKTLTTVGSRLILRWTGERWITVGS